MTAGRFWTPEFGRAYEDLQSKLADRYDADPAKVGDWYAAISWAADIGTNSIELNMKYATYDDPTVLAADPLA